MVKNEETDSNKDKLNMAAEILQNEDSMLIYFDPRPETVLVPPNLRESTRQALEFGMNLPIPIESFILNKEGIGGTLSFNRSPFFCWVPWDKVFCITISGTVYGREWEESVPKDDLLLKDMAVKKKRSAFKLIKGEKKQSNNDNVNKSKSHLSLVK